MRIKRLACAALAVLTAGMFSSCNVSGGSQSATVNPNGQSSNSEKASTYNFVEIKQKTEQISAKLDNIISSNKYVGTTYMKLGNDFEYLKSGGYANKEAHISNSINTCYYTGSVTKQFTAAAVMTLCEENKLSLDSTLEDFFPNYKYADEITVENLLNMTSGIDNYLQHGNAFDNCTYIAPDLEAMVSKENTANKNKEIILDWIFKQDLLFAPGETFMFSDSNYYLLGEIIAKVSGTTYEKYITERILKPLGMGSSGFKPTKSLAKTYQDSSLNESVLYNGVAYSSIGLISNVSDLLKWVDGFLNEEIVSRESLNKMFKPQKNNYGYGFYVHGNRISQWGKTESYNAMLSFTSDKSEIFVSLSNDSSSDPVYLYRQFNDLFSRFLA